MEIAGRVGNCERAAAGRCDTAALRLSLGLLHRLDAAIAQRGMIRDRTDFGFPMPAVGVIFSGQNF